MHTDGRKDYLKNNKFTVDLQDFFDWWSLQETDMENKRRNEMALVCKEQADVYEAYLDASDEIELIMTEFVRKWGGQMDEFTEKITSIDERYKMLAGALNDCIFSLIADVMCEDIPKDGDLNA